jgi:hypothetical protein
MDGLLFGVFDNGILIALAYAGINLDKKLGGSGRLGGIIGAALGNTISDCCGALIDPSIPSKMALGITLGCILPMLLIPVIETLKTKKNGN